MLGIKGLKHKDKQEAKKELAIRLGATVSAALSCSILPLICPLLFALSHQSPVTSLSRLAAKEATRQEH